ncbi:membrane protein [Xylella phage Xfas53]|uniref:membrane protein n=1 Tax=Xylella phage Xfas53 TaxID=670252 RepID=UPI0001B60FF3|nr:membrane protein [Xylella phage Xfas53]ACV41142.1 inner membrane protein [Xylella phage Xfas53]
MISVAHSLWSGLLPTPDQLAHLDEVVPGAAERIIKMVEQEGNHSREARMLAVKTGTDLQKAGITSAIMVALFGLGLSFVLGITNHDTVAAILGGTSLTAVVLAFLRKNKSDKSEEK